MVGIEKSNKWGGGVGNDMSQKINHKIYVCKVITHSRHLIPTAYTDIRESSKVYSIDSC